jgi:hypothetical protein
MRQLALLIENQPQDHDGHPSFAQRFAVARLTHTSSIGRVVPSYRSANERQSQSSPHATQISVRFRSDPASTGSLCSGISIKTATKSPSPLHMDRQDAAGHIYTFGTLRPGAGRQAILHTGVSTSYTATARRTFTRSELVCLDNARQSDSWAARTAPEGTPAS